MLAIIYDNSTLEVVGYAGLNGMEGEVSFLEKDEGQSEFKFEGTEEFELKLVEELRQGKKVLVDISEDGPTGFIFQEDAPKEDELAEIKQRLAETEDALLTLMFGGDM